MPIRLPDITKPVTSLAKDIFSANNPAIQASQAAAGIKPGAQPAQVIGDFVSTAYGPPWGGIQGTGVTADGTNLKNNPHIYGVAVDPSVIPLGTYLLIWPNPFGYKGAFKAFDTGGAIKGRRIDFYDWRGRAQQNGWGRRNIRVAKAANQKSQVDPSGNMLTPSLGQSASSGLANLDLGWRAVVELIQTLLSPKGLGTLLSRVFVFFWKLVLKAVWEVLFAPLWHWVQRAVDYYFTRIMSAKEGSGFYYQNAGIITILFWSIGYGILWGKAEDGLGMASRPRESMLGRTVRSGQNAVAARKVTKPKHVEKETPTKPDTIGSEVPVSVNRTLSVARRRPVRVKGSTEGVTNGTDTDANADGSQQFTESTE